MRYVISDIHGCKNEFLKLLKKINFSYDDYLYVLGDVVDRGDEPMGVLQDMMKRSNVTFLVGNHDYYLYRFIKKIGFDFLNFKSDEDKREFRSWVREGGLTTIDGFLDLNIIEKRKVFKFLENAEWCVELYYEDKRYILAHAGINSFEENKPLEEYDCLDFISGRMDYNKRYFSDENTYIISGHTPTPLLREDGKPEIVKKNNHIAIDCGCVFGGQLAAYCIETGETVYVKYGE